MEIKDDAAFLGTLTDDVQKTYFTNALKRDSEAAVVKFKTDAETERKGQIPEKYEFKFGEKTVLDPNEDAAKMAEFAKAQGFTKDQAQAFAALVDDRATAVTSRDQVRREQESAEWRKQVEADKELGGTNLDATVKNIKRAMDRFGGADSEFAKFIEKYNYGNHPGFVRFLNAIGKAMREDAPPFIREGETTVDDEKVLEGMYPSAAKKS